MTLIKKHSDPLKYTVTIVPRYYTNSMTATIREKMNNVVNTFSCTTSNNNGVSVVTINAFTPVENAKYELILSYNNTIIWQGQIMLPA